MIVKITSWSDILSHCSFQAICHLIFTYYTDSESVRQTMHFLQFSISRVHHSETSYLDGYVGNVDKRKIPIACYTWNYSTQLCVSYCKQIFGYMFAVPGSNHLFWNWFRSYTWFPGHVEWLFHIQLLFFSTKPSFTRYVAIQAMFLKKWN